MSASVWGVRFRLQDLRFRVSGLEFGVLGFWFRDSVDSRGDTLVPDLDFFFWRLIVESIRFRVQDSGFRIWGAGFRVSGEQFRVQGFIFRVEEDARLSAKSRNSSMVLGLNRSVPNRNAPAPLPSPLKHQMIAFW